MLRHESESDLRCEPERLRRSAPFLSRPPACAKRSELETAPADRRPQRTPLQPVGSTQHRNGEDRVVQYVMFGEFHGQRSCLFGDRVRGGHFFTPG